MRLEERKFCQKEYRLNSVDDLKNILRNFYEKNIDDFKNYFNELPY